MPNAPYNDYWGYQDNLLPKYHKKIGHDVTVVVTNTMHKDGKIVEIPESDYILNDGVRVIRLKRKKYCHRVLTNLNSKIDVMPYLTEIKPDYIFFHGLISSTIYDIVKYKKKFVPNCIIVQDNHLDYNNGLKNKGLKEKIIRAYYRHNVKKTIKYVDKIYGVTPWRKKYAEEYFKVPSNKIDVLIMGADDENIDFINSATIRQEIRKKYGIKDSDYLIVTGGKLDAQKNVIELMKACAKISNVKLLIFGSVLNDIRNEFEDIISTNSNIVYVGWVDSDKTYNYFLASDLVCFPGTHSVMWEQACACKTPCLFQFWEGVEHLNNGGNSDFIFPVTVDTIKAKINELLYTDKYYQMKAVANSDKTNIYLYSKIAEKSLTVVENKYI